MMLGRCRSVAGLCRRFHLQDEQRFGFDYLRDNMKFELADCVKRGPLLPIVDEWTQS